VLLQPVPELGEHRGCEHEMRAGVLRLANAEAGFQYGSWDLTDLRDLTSNDYLVHREIARRITLSFRYSHETAWANVHRLTERATATFTRMRLKLRYPEAALHSAPRKLAPGADPLKGFELLLEQVIGEREVPWETMTAALSGGVDSANVAMSLAAMRPEQRLVSFSMMLGGPAKAQQVRRRALMVDRGRFRDVTVPILDHLPLNPDGVRAKQRVSPYEEIYVEGYAATLEALKERGINTVFSGTGGDEMVSLREEEWATRDEHWKPTYPSWVSREAIEHLEAIEENAAPASVISEVTLIAFASIAPTYLRAGMWPVSPFASELIRFGEWLPVEWRQGKRLLRERLISLGFPTEIGYPEQRENFVHVIEAAMTKYGMTMVKDYLTESMLVNYGYADADGLREAYETARFSPKDREVLYQFLNWELGLRAFSNP
jgi:asparagine synthase (glutamine-hydrolysing)